MRLYDGLRRRPYEIERNENVEACRLGSGVRKAELLVVVRVLPDIEGKGVNADGGGEFHVGLPVARVVSTATVDNRGRLTMPLGRKSRQYRPTPVKLGLQA